MVSPQVPAGWPVGHAVCDHETYGPLDDTMRGMAPWRGQIREIDVEMLPTLRTVVRRIPHQQVDRTTCIDLSKSVQRALPLCVTLRLMATSWAGRLLLVTAAHHDLRRWEVLDIGHAFGRVWHILTRSEHRSLSFVGRLGPAVEKETPTLSISISESPLQSPKASETRKPLPRPNVHLKRGRNKQTKARSLWILVMHLALRLLPRFPLPGKSP